MADGSDMSALYFTPTGMRGRASPADWARLADSIGTLARHARGLEMITGDRDVDTLAEGLEELRDIAFGVARERARNPA